MAKHLIIINEGNLVEWMHSVGCLLPRNSIELWRFEKLHVSVQHCLNIDHVNPINITNGSWHPRKAVLIEESFKEDIYELGMAARNHQEIPPDILERIRRKHTSNGDSENTQRKD